MTHYSLFEAIASGGMGTVHYGRASSGLSRVVAVKRMHGELARDPKCLTMFQDELRLATRVRHPNVVATLDMVEQEGELLMVMEYVQGESLQELIARAAIRSEPVPPAIAVSILCGILQGLEAVHEAKSETGERLNIVHRDVSPENILIGRDGIARLLDFGIARGAGRKHVTRVGEIKGKPSYLSPEQVLGKVADRRSDIYSASVVLWEALTGRRLFDAATPTAILSRVLHEDPPRPSRVVSSLPQGLDEVVMRGLSRDPEQRFASALEMAKALRCVCGSLLPFEVGEWLALKAPESLARQAELVARLEALPLREAPSESKRAIPLAALGPRPGDEESNTARITMELGPRRTPTGRKPLPKLIKRLAKSHKLVRTAAFGAFTGVCFIAGIFLATHIKLQPSAAPVAAATLDASLVEPPPVLEPAPVPVPAPRVEVVAPQADGDAAAAEGSKKSHKKSSNRRYSAPAAGTTVATPARPFAVAVAGPAHPIPTTPARRIDDGF